MSILVASDWKDYELIECSNGQKLERWKDILLLRPDPQVIWNDEDLTDKYKKIDAIYHRSNKGGGYWENLRPIPAAIKVNYKNLSFFIKQMGFKHTGLFPEQSVNWDYMIEKIRKSNKEIKVLNLFGYTGGSSVACLSAGASVVHVDSSRGMVDWCKENVKVNGLENKPIRYIVDDVVKFVKRESRRGNKYDAIIMDPPSYGRGTNGEVWDIEKDLLNLLRICNEILVEEPLFVIINTYTTGLSQEVFTNLLKSTIGKNRKGNIYSFEVGLPIKDSDMVLPCGVCTRYEN